VGWLTGAVAEHKSSHLYLSVSLLLPACILQCKNLSIKPKLQYSQSSANPVVNRKILLPRRAEPFEGGVETTNIMDIQSVYRLCKEGIKFLKKKNNKEKNL
jgi:hypothetical protein